MKRLLVAAVMAALLIPGSAQAAPPAPCKPRPIGASLFTGSTGYRGDNLNHGPLAYAELGMGWNMGHLPRGYRLRFVYHGHTAVGHKLDVGLGGGPVNGLRRDVDLHGRLARAIRFPYGIDVVRVLPAWCPWPPYGRSRFVRFHV